jgi:hypothetical protein
MRWWTWSSHAFRSWLLGREPEVVAWDLRRELTVVAVMRSCGG